MFNLSLSLFGYEVSFLNISITTAIGSKYNLRNKGIIKNILKLTGLPHLGARVRAFYLNNLLDQLQQNSIILDAGCGIGLNCFLAARKGFTVLGVDNDRVKIESARQMLLKTSYSNVQFKLGDILKLSSIKQSFDCVMCFEVLEHIEDDDKAIQEISKVIKKDGTLILSVPGKGFISSLNQTSKHHVREGYTLPELEGKLNSANLKIRQVIGIEHTPLGLLLRYTNDAFHKRSLIITTLFFFVFFPLAIFDGLLPQIVTPQNWIIVVEKQ